MPHPAAGARDETLGHMTELSKTIAVVGTSPFALLLAGLLATDHSRGVVLVTEPANPFRLSRQFSLSVGALTRPNTWQLVRANAQGVLRRLGRLSSGAVERTDLMMLAEDAQSAQGLRHVHHMAAGFGYVVERPVAPTPNGVALLFRDVHRLVEAAFVPAALEWLEKSGVVIVEGQEKLSLVRGGGRLDGGAEAELVVLADDDAVRRFLPSGELNNALTPVPATSLLTTATARLDQSIILHVDSGAVVSQRGDGGLEIVAPDAGGQGPAIAGTMLPPSQRPRLAARHSHTRLVSVDGAPVLGSPAKGRPFVIGGLGPVDMMLAPTIARILCQAPVDFEAQWAFAHQPSGRKRRAVAEFSPGDAT